MKCKKLLVPTFYQACPPEGCLCGDSRPRLSAEQSSAGAPPLSLRILEGQGGDFDSERSSNLRLPKTFLQPSPPPQPLKDMLLRPQPRPKGLLSPLPKPDTLIPNYQYV